MRHRNTLLAASATFGKGSGASVWHDMVMRGVLPMCHTMHMARVSDTGAALSIKVEGTHRAFLRLDGRMGAVDEGLFTT
jgi:hypothetical protein